MDETERRLLNLIQGQFPIHPEPYRVLGESLGITPEAAFAKVKHLYDLGIIRRLGGVFDSRRLGYFSTLCTAKVPEDKVSLTAELLAGIPGVTHNYLRDHPYNMWFTLIASSPQKAGEILRGIREATGVEVFSLPALRVFKIRVDLDMGAVDWPEKEPEGDLETENLGQEDLGPEAIEEVERFFQGTGENVGMQEQTPAWGWVDADRPLIRVLQRDLPHVLNPFKDLASRLEWPEEQVLTRTESLLESAVIRRFGAVLRHQKAGFLANAMGVWQVGADRVEEAGLAMAGFREVSHCYERPALPDWSYNLFTMVHGRTPEDCRRVMESIAAATGISHFGMLFSQAELKKSSMEYFMEED